MQLPILTTQRTFLREFTTEDSDELVTILSNPEVMKYSMTGPMDKVATQELINNWTSNYQSGIYSPWAIIHEEHIIGFAGFDVRIVEEQEKVQITFRLDHKYWGKGLATEVILAIKNYAFSTMKLQEFIAIVDPNNANSIRVLKNIGMHYHQPVNYGGLNLDIYKITL